jgi:hypothetical protein
MTGFQSFFSGIEKLFKSMDKNGDGLVTKQVGFFMSCTVMSSVPDPVQDQHGSALIGIS